MKNLKNKLGGNYSYKNIIKDIYKYRENIDIIPEINHEAIFNGIEKEIEKRGSGFLFGRHHKVAIFSMVVVIICIVFFIFKPKIMGEKLQIDELKTEIIISDSNIKILWIQKKDFDLKKLK